MDWIPVLAKQYNLDESEFSLYIVEAVPTILNMLDEKDAAKAEKFMTSRGIKVIKGNGIEEVKEKQHSFSRPALSFQLTPLFWTAGVKSEY